MRALAVSTPNEPTEGPRYMTESDERSVDGPAGGIVDWLWNWYHVFVVAGLFGFMFWVRARTWENFVVDGTVLFSGNDAWYHLREASYTVANWPNTMPFDPWTEFPFGTSVSQFGTLFDQLIATTAILLGLGAPNDQLIRMVHLFAPAVFGAAVVVPTYFLGKRVGDRIGGLIAALVVALSAGELLRRSLVGFSDHHAPEVFFQAIAVLAILVALRVAQREKPVYELLVDRDWAALRRPLGWAAIAGVAMAVYMSVWPPGILLVGILGVYVTIQLPIAHLRGESPEHVGIVAGTIFLVAAVLSLAALDSIGLSMVETSLAQPGLSIAGVGWVVVLSWLARAWDRRGLDAWQYPVAVFGGLLVAVGLLAVVAPDLVTYFVDQLLRFVGFTVNPTATASTVGEVQPLPLSQAGLLLSWLGVAPAVAAVGVVLAIAHQYVAEELDPTYLFVALWFVFFVAATFTQQRFAYYLTIPAATMTALVVARLFEYLRTVSDRSDGVETYQALVVGGVIVALVVPMVFPFPPSALAQSSNNGPGGVSGWQSSLEYMETETPAVGDFAGAGNADRMDFYGTYERTEDFSYPDGAYGVMSWWDYGHWITQEGERIPVANPFQGNADEAAAFLMAQNETQAGDALEVVSENGTDAETRYVMADWKMATANGGFGNFRWGKFFAPSAFLDNVSESTYYQRIQALAQTQQGTSITGQYFTVQKQAYYETMAVRLYRYHGSAASTTNVPGVPSTGQVPVVDWDDTEVELTDGTQTTWHVPATGQNGSAQTVRFFQNRTAAEAFVEEDGTAQIGGLGKIPSEPVPALQHYRLAQVSEQQQNPYLASQPGLAWFAQNQQYQTGVSTSLLTNFAESYPAWTKIFERVPGATVEGTGPADATVTAAVEMEMPNANQTFMYRQHAETGPDGEFTMTLPYSTTGYENWGPEEGYTNVSVRANGSYEFRTSPTINSTAETIQRIAYTDSADVTEAQVIGTADSPVTVDLTRSVLAEQEIEEAADETTNVTVENGTDVNDTAGANATGDGVTDDDTGTNTTSESVRRAGPTATATAGVARATPGALAPAVRSIVAGL